ncbi:MAG: PD-(D/E)XK nuclease-like domain-containing protein [Myxococcota bacterium]
MIDPGIYGPEEISMAGYLKDPCPEPSLSTGAVRLITAKTPEHVYANHPRLGGGEDESFSPRAGLGDLAHALSFPGGKPVHVVEGFDDWRKKAAQEERDAAIAEGKIAALQRDYDKAMRMSERLRPVLEDLGAAKTEQTIIAKIDGVWSRGRADWLSADTLRDLDYKTTGDAHPDRWAKKVMTPMEYHIQAELRRQSLDALFGEDPRRHAVWLLQEIEPPYSWSFAAPDQATQDQARSKVDAARRAFGLCLRSGEWPGYGMEINRVSAAAWSFYDWEAQDAHWLKEPEEEAA